MVNNTPSPLSTAMAVLICFILLSRYGAHAATSPSSAASAYCASGKYELRFRETGSFITKSYKSGDAPLNVTMGSAMPVIVVQVLDSNGDLDVEATGFNVSVVATPANTDLGTVDEHSAPVLFGEAFFERLAIHNPIDNVVLTFYSPNITKKVNLTAAPIALVTQLTHLYYARFSETSSYITSSTSSIEVPVGYTLPVVRVDLLDSAYNRGSQEDAATTAYCNVSFSSTDSNVLASTLTGSTENVPFKNGIASFAGLKYTGTAGSSNTEHRLKFVCYLSSLRTYDLYSGPVTFITTPQSSSHMMFSDASVSFLSTAHSPFTAVNKVALPIIRIRLLDRFLRDDTTNTGIIVSASCDGRVALTGADVGVISGIATFSDLTLSLNNGLAFPANVSEVPLYLTFTAGSQGHQPVSGKTLVTGIVRLMNMSVSGYSVRFGNAARSLVAAEDVPISWVLHEPLPAIRIRILTSGNTLDTKKHPVQMEVECTELGVKMYDDWIVRDFVDGVATFTSIRFFSVGATPPKLTFTVIGDETYHINRKKLITGAVTVAKTIQPNFDLRFQPYGSSLFSATGQATFASSYRTLPLIIVELLNNAGIVDQSNDEITITVTASGGAQLSNSVLRVYQGNAYFSDLTFIQNYTITGVKLTFTAGDEGKQTVQGKQLVTGGIDVLAGVLEAYALRFDPTLSYFTYPAEVKTIVLSKKMPPIVLSIVNSDHSLTDTATLQGTVIECTASIVDQLTTQRLEGNSTVLFNTTTGRATFSDLVFVAASADQTPTLRFCARATQGGEKVHFGTFACTSTGGLIVDSYVRNVRNLVIFNDSTVSNLTIARPHQNYSVSATGGAGMSFSVRVADSYGEPPDTIELPSAASCELSSAVPLKNTIAQFSPSGIATFRNVLLVNPPRGIAPILTFSARHVEDLVATHDVSGAMAITFDRAFDDKNVPTLVAEINQRFELFSVSTWSEQLTMKLNIDYDRFRATRVAQGRYENGTIVWIGTRIEFKFAEPTVRSQNKQSSADLSRVIVNLVPAATGIRDLRLKRVYYLDGDETCDMYLFRENMEGSEMCEQGGVSACYETEPIIRDGQKLYVRKPNFAVCRQQLMCSCYDALYTRLGKKCITQASLETLCQGTVIGQVIGNRYKLDECSQPGISTICKLLEPAPVSRVQPIVGAVVGSVVFVALVIAWKAKVHEKLAQQRLSSGGGFSSLVLDNVAKDQEDRLM
eukprot:PhM_4_TR11065/c0_g2_i1/m.90704